MKLKSNYQPRPHILIAVGLLGITLYQFIMRLNHPAFMDKDFFHGLWLGCFLGIEIIGLILLCKAQGKRAA